MGGGVALIDVNRDNRLDIFALQNVGDDPDATSTLLIQQSDGTFSDGTAEAGLRLGGWNQGVAVGDVNNDGWDDLLVTQYLGVRLFINQSKGQFADRTLQAGLHNPHWGTSAGFWDYDRDGWLDLVVVNYVNYDPNKDCSHSSGRPDFCGPSAFGGTVSRLFRNLGAQVGAGTVEVKFEDVTASAGLGSYPGPGLGLVTADFDGDLWPDLFIANDGRVNWLFMNQRDGTFKEEGLLRGVAMNVMGGAEANMGVAIGDADGDGLFDLFVTHLVGEAHRLWKQGPQGQFVDATGKSGLIRHRSTGFGTVMADFDLDGDDDLFLVNGAVALPSTLDSPPDGTFWDPYKERNLLLMNDGSGSFLDRSGEENALCGSPGVYRGAAVGDLNDDGALDLVVSDIADSVSVYFNQRQPSRHWLLIRTVDPALNRVAYGAEVKVSVGGKKIVRWANPAFSFACSNDPRVHFGLGDATRVDSIKVRWPDGSEETFPGLESDQIVELRRGEGEVVPSAGAENND
jgi:hypothetical protein